MYNYNKHKLRDYIDKKENLLIIENFLQMTDKYIEIKLDHLKKKSGTNEIYDNTTIKNKQLKKFEFYFTQRDVNAKRKRISKQQRKNAEEAEALALEPLAGCNHEMRFEIESLEFYKRFFQQLTIQCNAKIKSFLTNREEIDSE